MNSLEPRLRFDEEAVAAWFAQLEGWGGPVPPAGEISLVFLSDAALAKLHDDFLDDPSPTDVITFPGDAGMGTAGEICVSAERAWLEHRQQGHAFGAELALYVVHGWLHLAGFDDRTDEARAAMRNAEAKLLADPSRRGALPEFAWEAEAVAESGA